MCDDQWQSDGCEWEEEDTQVSADTPNGWGREADSSCRADGGTGWAGWAMALDYGCENPLTTVLWTNLALQWEEGSKHMGMRQTQLLILWASQAWCGLSDLLLKDILSLELKDTWWTLQWVYLIRKSKRGKKNPLQVTGFLAAKGSTADSISSRKSQTSTRTRVFPLS